MDSNPYQSPQETGKSPGKLASSTLFGFACVAGSAGLAYLAACVSAKLELLDVFRPYQDDAMMLVFAAIFVPLAIGVWLIRIKRQVKVEEEG